MHLDGCTPHLLGQGDVSPLLQRKVGVFPARHSAPVIGYVEGQDDVHVDHGTAAGQTPNEQEVV